MKNGNVWNWGLKSKNMKKSLLFIILTAVMTFSAFSRGTFPIETVEICVAFGSEDYLKNILPSEYQIVKIHPSEKGSASIKQEFVRDIQISKTLDGEEKNVGYVYPYYENKEPDNLKGKLPVKVILNNDEKQFDESGEKLITICFAIETDDADLLNILTKMSKDDEYLKTVKARINRDSYIDDYKIKDKITLITLPI